MSKLIEEQTGLHDVLRGAPRSSCEFHRPDLRYRRAQSMVHAILQEVAPFLPRGVSPSSTTAD